MSSQDRRPPPPALDEPTQAHIGQQLKKFYSSILTEPMPSRFEQLLDELERKERSIKGADDAGDTRP